jgi:hypothetical protein
MAKHQARAGAAAAAPATTKTCRRCGFEKPIAEFRPQHRVCRLCQSALRREAYWRNPEKERQQMRERRRTEGFREYAREYRRRNIEKYRARNRAWFKTELGREQNRRSKAAYRARNLDKISVRNASRRAMKRGEIERATVCEALGCDRTDRLHAHHSDYSKPHDVVFLCVLHHAAVHHKGQLRLKPGGRRKFARPPRLAVRTRKAA